MLLAATRPTPTYSIKPQHEQHMLQIAGGRPANGVLGHGMPCPYRRDALQRSLA
jgi:hypothetical protein